MQSEIIIYGLVRKCEALTCLIDNTYIRFGPKLYRKIVGIPMATNCVAGLFLFFYERDFMLSVSDDKSSEVIEVSILLFYFSVSGWPFAY